MRDLVLAQQYADANIIFATQDLSGNIDKKIEDAGYRVKKLKSNRVDELIKLVKKLDIDLVVIDSYDIDYKYEKKLKLKTDVKVMVLDDTYQKHYCDILLNHNIYADAKKYKDLVPKNCELRCGAKYTLLREEFIKAKKKKYKKADKFTIFLAMGGADTANLNIEILKVLKKFKNVKVYLVTTDANKHLDKLKNYYKKKKYIKLHINSKKVAKLMAKSHLAIVTPSIISNETYFMKLPFIAIKTANNQHYMYSYLKKIKNKTLKKFSSKKLLNLFKELI